MFDGCRTRSRSDDLYTLAPGDAGYAGTSVAAGPEPDDLKLIMMLEQDHEGELVVEVEPTTVTLLSLAPS